MGFRELKSSTPTVRSPRLLPSPREAGIKSNVLLCDIADERTHPDSLDESRTQLQSQAALLLKEAEKAMVHDKFLVAERAASEALHVFREIGNKVGAASSLRVIISSFQGRSELVKAADRAQEELERCQESGNHIGEAAMMISLAELALDTSRSKALKLAKSALAMAQLVADRNLEAQALLAQARAYENQSKVEHMHRAARAALEAFRQLENKIGQAQALHCLGTASSLENDLPEAIRRSQESLAIFKELEFTSMEAAELLSLADYNRSLKDHAQMLQDAESSMSLYRQVGQTDGESRALRLVVKAYCLNGEDSKALEVAQQAVLRFQDAGFRRGEAIALDQLAAVLHNQKKLEQAVETALDALEIIRLLQDLPWEAIMLHSLAVLHCAAKQYPESLKAANEALEILEELGDVSGQAYVRLNTILQVQQQLDAQQEALNTASECINLFREVKDKKGEGTALLLAANVYRTIGDFEEAEKCLQEAREIFEDLGERRLLAQVFHGLAKLHIARKEPGEAVRLGYEAHSHCRRAKDKPAEAGTLLFTVEAHLSVIAQLVENGRTRGSRELEEQLSKAAKAGAAAKKIAEKLGHQQTIADCLYALAEIHLVSGNYAEALAGADEGIKIYQDVGYALGECTFVNMRAQALLVSGRNDEALVAASEAVNMAQDMDDKPLEKLGMEILEKIQTGGGAGPQVQAQAQQPQFIDQPQQPSFNERETATAAAPAEVEEETPKGLEPALVSDMLHSMLHEMIGSPMESDTPFMDAGVDSLMSIEFRSQVNAAFAGLGLASTITFDYPTIRELTGHVVDKSKNQ